MKCFSCLRDEYYGKIKYSRVQEAITMLEGRCYCFKHFSIEMGWKDEVQEK